MKKKLMVMALGAVVGAALLAGCGKEQQAPAEEVSAQETTQESEPEPVQEAEPATEEETTQIEPASPTSLDDALAQAVLSFNAERFEQREVSGEGHILMGQDDGEDGEIKCYVLSMYGTYEFQDGNFVVDGGTGAIPCVVTLKLNENGEYDFISLVEAEDGSRFVDSIKENFPENLWSRCITTEDDDRVELERQQNAYAEEYLSSIGREDADVGYYSDFEHELLTDLGVSEEVSNKMSDLEAGDGIENKCPFWVGEREVLEDNVRYTYKKDYDEKKKTIVYSKILYDTGEVLESSSYSAKTGDKVD